MTDQQLIKRIGTFDAEQMLRYIMENPEVMTDPYYKDIKRALVSRYKDITL